MAKRFYRHLQMLGQVSDELSSWPSVIALLFALTPTKNLSAQSCSEITNQNRLSVVQIQAEKTVKTTGAVRVYGGTGFIVSSSGLVVTNRHVVAPEPNTEQEVKISG